MGPDGTALVYHSAMLRQARPADMKHITSRQNPLVARCRAVAQGDDRTLLLLDGVHLVDEALAAGWTMREVAVSQTAMDTEEVATLAARLQDAGVDVMSATSAVMAALSPVQSSSPIVALAARPHASDADLFRTSVPLVVAANDVQDPGNVGAIARVAEAGGSTGLAITGRSADPFGWKALRGSMGSSLRLPIVTHADTAAIVDEARRRGCRVIASVPRGGREPDRTPLSGPVLLLVGGEGPGLPAAIIARADDCVTVPMAPPVESLNTAVCAALLVYEARRQRLAQAAHGLAVSRQS